MAPRSLFTIEYKILSLEEIDSIGPLWEKLNSHHAALSVNFSGEISDRSFVDRKVQLLERGILTRLVLVILAGTPTPIGYCLSSRTPSGEGEIESIFIEEQYRSIGIGTHLMHDALAWLDGHSVRTKSVVVLAENNAAMSFYERFGFHSRNTKMVQKPLEKRRDL